MASNNTGKYYLFAMKAMGEITAVILAPGLIAIFLHHFYLSLRYHRLIFFCSLVVVFSLSMLAVLKKVHQYGEEYQKLIDDTPSDGGGPGR